jgi:uncharacterized membrane protein YsdA (DUF1294 family)
MKRPSGCGLNLFFWLLMALAGVWIFYQTELPAYPAWLLSLSIVTFCFYGFDKWQSQRKGWRISEMTLHTLALLGGFLGGWAGLFWFRHKTKHPWFFVVLVLATLLHISLLNAGLIAQ